MIEVQFIVEILFCQSHPLGDIRLDNRLTVEKRLGRRGGGVVGCRIAMELRG